MRVYLCGAMSGCTDEEAKVWRDEVSNKLKVRNIVPLNPMERDYRDKDTAEKYKYIVEEDKIDIMMSDIVLVNYSRPSVGTSMEILLAWENNKRVVLVHPPGIFLSPWLLYHTHDRFTSMDEALQKIIDINLKTCDTW